MHHTRIKICGITIEADAHAVIAAGADALGFNTWTGSRRYLDLAAAEWVGGLPPFVTRVALLVDAPLDEAVRVALLPFIDAVQLHGNEDRAYCTALARHGRPIIKAIRLKSGSDLSQIGEFAAQHILIDAYVPGQFGGTGERADLAMVSKLRREFPLLRVVLAGGLTPENVGDAVRTVRPYAVDASSGVESEPGRKDSERLRAFVHAVRAADCADAS